MVRRKKLAYLLSIGLVFMITLSMFNAGQNTTRALDGTLESVFATTPPVVDGVGGDAVWADAESISTSSGATIKSVYTDTTIYFLFTWSDSTESNAKNQWSFSAGKWSKSGNEDRLALFWDMGNVADFDSEGCQVICHLGVGGNTSRNAMSTNGDTEKGDMWHWKAARGNAVGYADDKWMNNDAATDEEWAEDDHDAMEAAHHGDSKDSGSYNNNKQTLSYSDDSANETSVPKYYEPDATGEDAVFITAKEITDGEAELITGVDKNGTLTYAGGNVPSDAKIPGYTLERAVGSRGDISASGKHASGKWTLELSRPLDTKNDDDVKFTTGKDDAFFFGVAVFDNAGGISHKTSGSNSYKLVFKQQVADADGDGVDDNSDAFPKDPAASKDSDSDGYPGEWNTGKSKSDSTTNLTIDEYPDDSTKWLKESEDKEDDGEDDDNSMIIIVIIIVIVVIVVLAAAMGKKKKPEESGKEGSKEEKSKDD